MKSCLKIPRILLPEQGFEKWAVIACDRHASDGDYWRRVEQEVGDAPSTLHFILPEAHFEQDDKSVFEAIGTAMYRALEEGVLEKLTRGFVLTRRKTQSGVREGILAAIDLEAYTMSKGELSPIRASEEVERSSLGAKVALRSSVPLEFPHAMLFYNDKKGKVKKLLKGEDLEKLYDFELMEGGGHIEGYFLPEDTSLSLTKVLQGRGELCFAVADGNDCVAAAKVYWEELKKRLSEHEKHNHPARHMLVELVNLYDEAIDLHPVHRLMKDVDEEAFCDYFMRAVKCKREGNVLYPALPAGAESVKRCNELCEEYVRVNGGVIDYIQGESKLKALAGGNCVGVVLKTVEKESFFKQLEGGGIFPKRTFSVGEENEKRYYLEGREISYE